MFTNAQGPTRDNYARKEEPVARKIGASRKSGNSRQAIGHIAHACLTQAESLITRWLPGGRREGNEWVALNPTRPDAHPGSFKVNLETGFISAAGNWLERASSEWKRCAALGGPRGAVPKAGQDVRSAREARFH